MVEYSEEEVKNWMKYLMSHYYKTQEVSVTFVLNKKNEFKCIAKLTRKNEIKMVEWTNPIGALSHLDILLNK